LLLLIHMLSFMLMHVAPVMLNFRGWLPVITGVALMLGGIAGLRGGLVPFASLRQRLTAVRTGLDRRVDGQFPTEVQPLVDDLNALLDDRDKAVTRALATAGDLAHGLKTPLALLAQEAHRAETCGNGELAASIAQQVENMSRQVNYHLARARAAASGANGAVRCPLADCADGLVRTLSKLYSDRALKISANIAPGLLARVQREDLEEILGNLLDNACKWARSEIALAAVQEGARLALTIDDDGPGLSPELRPVVLERGVRLDETGQGSGLGLAIVRDLAELYGGAIQLHESPLGGLRVRLSVPAC
jgi:signal transduction histidine kinase